MTVKTPTQDFVKQLIASGNWPAIGEEIVDPASLQPNQRLYCEWYMLEEIIKQQDRANELLSRIVEILGK